jgi:manganese-dependent inorganic pyrophosphatase
MEKVYIFGHRNPDTDSVTAAITLSYLKNKLGMNTIPAVLSSINLESKFALNYFNVPEPIFLNDVNIKLRDLKYTKNYTVKEKDSIYEAYFRMNKVGISKIPVVDKDKNMIGILSMKDISDKRVNISLDNPSITFDKNKCDECSICKNILAKDM